METSKSAAAYNRRLNKEDHFMALAFWMEGFPDDNHKQSGDPLYKKVGAVLVLPNDMCYAIDCSRNGVHAVARLIMAHPNIPENCKVFVSRKPCSFCTKLLVQAKVERVFYLPMEPEYFPMKEQREEAKRRGKCFESETSCVDNLFKVSPIGQTIFVPEVPKAVVKSVPKKFETPEAIRGNMKSILKKLYWDQSSSFNEKEDLPWPSFDDDDDMRKNVKQQFDNLIEWMGTFCVAPEKGYSFELVGEGETKISFDPRDEERSKQANHLMTLAKILAMRTDDPTTGVGAVIVNEKMEIVGLGWNGFPKKARYGEFARASRKDEGVQDKKYPYSIHAEQNALMMRNTKNVEGGTLFVTKTPCDECTPLLEMQEITTVVLGEQIQDGARQGIRYTGFHEGHKFTRFLMKWNVDGPKRKLEDEIENVEKPGTSQKIRKTENN